MKTPLINCYLRKKRQNKQWHYHVFNKKTIYSTNSKQFNTPVHKPIINFDYLNVNNCPTKCTQKCKWMMPGHLTISLYGELNLILSFQIDI